MRGKNLAFFGCQLAKTGEITHFQRTRGKNRLIFTSQGTTAGKNSWPAVLSKLRSSAQGLLLPLSALLKYCVYLVQFDRDIARDGYHGEEHLRCYGEKSCCQVAQKYAVELCACKCRGWLTDKFEIGIDFTSGENAAHTGCRSRAGHGSRAG